MMTIAVGLLVGIAMIAVASHVYWRIGQPDGLSARWRNLPGIESLLVLIVLGGWAGGASILIKSVTLAIWK